MEQAFLLQVFDVFGANAPKSSTEFRDDYFDDRDFPLLETSSILEPHLAPRPRDAEGIGRLVRNYRTE